MTDDVEAAGAIIRGVTRQVGNEIDEFVTDAVRNNLLGLPLDLPTINLARGRDTGVPPLNQARAEFYAMTGDSQLKPYIELGRSGGQPEARGVAGQFRRRLRHARDDHQRDDARGKRAAAYALVYGADGMDGDGAGSGDEPTVAVPPTASTS